MCHGCAEIDRSCFALRRFGVWIKPVFENLSVSVPRLISSILAASFLFQPASSSARMMWVRSASRSVGSFAGVNDVGPTFACRNSMSVARMTRPGADSAARETVLSSSRILPGQGTPEVATSPRARSSWRRVASRCWRSIWQGISRPGPECPLVVRGARAAGSQTR